MKAVTRLFLVAGLLVCGLGKGCCLGFPLPQQFPLGTIGCLFSDQLCASDEDCVDDLLFGSCQLLESPKDYYQYRLSTKALAVLEYEISRLIRKGLSWHNAYTQCILQNVILAYRQKQSFDESKCTDSLTYFTSDVSNEITAVLRNALNRYEDYDPEQVYIEDVDPNYLLDDISKSSKRNEIVQVHKYFDKSKGLLHKRKFSLSDVKQNLYRYLLFGPEVDSWKEVTQELLDSDVSLKDIQALQYYLHQLKSPHFKKDSSASNNDVFFDSYPSPKRNDRLSFPTNAGNDWPLEFEPGNLWTDVDEISRPVNEITEEEESVVPEIDQELQSELADSVVDDPVENKPQLLPSMPPSYANLLGKLLEGEIDAENLTDEQLDKITKYINSVLVQLGFSQQELTQLEREYQTRNGAIFKEDTPEFVDDPLETTDDKTGSDIRSSGNIETLEPQIREQLLLENSITEKREPEQEPVVADKKSIKEDNSPEIGELRDIDAPGAHAEEDLLYRNYAFVRVGENIQDNPRDVERLLESLEKILKVRLPTFDQVIVSGNTVTFEVDPLIVGLNATYVAEQANDHKDELEAETGLTFLESGIGRETKIEVKHDDHYFVLTFILCGCIAGILLTVVVIYLIRRHSRSREKLAQLASTGEGNEASKDYQDLCRQHMQSKSSEKPEPLHAATRIGSVSETQVRSPSSKSSTSSWSEEPVSSNMDISTGHIVLSYMEDHLKNKDRLDQEWEGLTAYEADPGSTNVASDPGNARKNRYSDVLPYDHSRVILSNTTNVSGSDYINASTITDHDPRNPAYIATQGSLPHTVADFWQMVWEQGSVVIVMLTKLTESGEAMCHRYWPEEGSDLYHIYEVHLVSEHIWCDDYLVRSFYLKNLQTNETRTVTQFHFLTWPDLGVPSSTKALLDFRRKVNKSYRGRSCPIVVHCSDGCGRTGIYCLIDMVLSRMTKGAKEIDIAATLEHIRDQRMTMVKTKEQFQFALAAVADEVHAILKALPQ